ncbi:MAG: lysylphosphatidylglycerol synthase transmembrane domain-containing protein [Caldilineaceae bacterium]
MSTLLTSVRRTFSLYNPRLLFILAAVGLLWFALRNVSLHEIWRLLHQLKPQHLLLLMSINGLIVVALGSRWWLFLAALGHRLPYLELARYRLAAFGVSYFTPGPHFGGEPLQVYLLQQRNGVTTADAVASVTLDKVFDLLFNFVFLCVGFLLILAQLPSVGFSAAAVPYAVLAAALPLGLLMATATGRRPVSTALGAMGRYAAWGQSVYDLAYSSESQMIGLCQRQPRALWMAALLSLLNWLMLIGEFWLATYILRLNLTLMQAVFIMVAARVAILLPMPAGLGALESGLVLAAGLLGLNPAAGISLGILIRARDILVGLLGLWLASVDVGQVS